MYCVTEGIHTVCGGRRGGGAACDQISCECLWPSQKPEQSLHVELHYKTSSACTNRVNICAFQFGTATLNCRWSDATVASTPVMGHKQSSLVCSKILLCLTSLSVCVCLSTSDHTESCVQVLHPCYSNMHACTNIYIQESQDFLLSFCWSYLGFNM